MTSITPGRDGIPFGIGIPAEILRALMCDQPTGVQTSPAIGSNAR